MYAVPVHVPLKDVQLSMALQYDPPGRLVVNVVLHSVSALLITTNPSAPEPA